MKKPKGLIFTEYLQIIFLFGGAIIFCFLFAYLFPFGMIGMLIPLFLFLASMWYLKLKIRQYFIARKNPWDKLFFDTESIKITKDDILLEELALDEISLIEFKRDFYGEKSIVIIYTIELNILLANNKSISFGEIYSSKDSEKRNLRYNYLQQMVKNRYRIEPFEEKGSNAWFTTNKKFFLWSIIGFIVLMAVAVIVTHIPWFS